MRVEKKQTFGSPVGKLQENIQTESPSTNFSRYNSSPLLASSCPVTIFSGILRQLHSLAAAILAA